MIEKAPPTRHKFSGIWDQIEYLYDKTFYWSWGQGNWRQAQRFADRLKRLIAKADPKSEALLGISCRALAAEVDGDLRKAIRFRQREIEMMRRLTQPDVPEFARLSVDEVRDGLDRLAIHYWDLGDLPKALETLDESRRYCAEHGLSFESEDIVDGICREKESAPARNGAISQRISKRSY